MKNNNIFLELKFKASSLMKNVLSASIHPRLLNRGFLEASNRGFTLLETVVVMAIIGILALIGVENIVEFQKNALLSNTAQEFTSALKRAQNMSIAGQLPEPVKDKNPDEFTSTGLPQYRINLAAGTYTLFSDYQLTVPPVPPPPPPYTVEATSFDTSKLSITSSPVVTEIIFYRLSGLPSVSTTFTISRVDNPSQKIEVSVDDKGTIL